MSDNSNKNAPAQWLSLWKDFKKSHSGWIAKLPAGEAAYILPEPIIKELASPRGGHRQLQPLIANRDAKAERDFEKVCRKSGPCVIGVCDNGPLHFPLLFESWNDAAKSIPTAMHRADRCWRGICLIRMVTER